MPPGVLTARAKDDVFITETAGNFMVGTAYSKTEPVQAALFGLLILGESISLIGLLAILIGAIAIGFIFVGKFAFNVVQSISTFAVLTVTCTAPASSRARSSCVLLRSPSQVSQSSAGRARARRGGSCRSWGPGERTGGAMSSKGSSTLATPTTTPPWTPGGGTP